MRLAPLLLVATAASLSGCSIPETHERVITAELTKRFSPASTSSFSLTEGRSIIRSGAHCRISVRNESASSTTTDKEVYYESELSERLDQEREEVQLIAHAEAGKWVIDVLDTPETLRPDQFMKELDHCRDALFHQHQPQQTAPTEAEKAAVAWKIAASAADR